jgi:ATP-binding cassette subfamily B protein
MPDDDRYPTMPVDLHGRISRHAQGRNGAGKSTLFKLLCRLYDPTGGRILLDGVDIREYDPVDLRTRISAMFQDYVTYQGHGRGEHRPRRPHASRGPAAHRGLGPPRGRGRADPATAPGLRQPARPLVRPGVSLSGGEWQKIALAGAFQREAPILILDEPTSALDAQAEHDLFARLRELSQGCTTLYISHRFSTVRQAERILLLEHGKGAE